jgi:hypothetical protein
MYRICEMVEHKIVHAIQEDLQVLRAIKEQIGYEIMPCLLPRGKAMPNLGFMIGISVPVAGTSDDFILHMSGLEDPHASQETVSGMVAELYAGAQAEADQMHAGILAAANGSKNLPRT